VLKCPTVIANHIHKLSKLANIKILATLTLTHPNLSFILPYTLVIMNLRLVRIQLALISLLLIPNSLSLLLISHSLSLLILPNTPCSRSWPSWILSSWRPELLSSLLLVRIKTEIGEVEWVEASTALGRTPSATTSSFPISHPTLQPIQRSSPSFPL
jgi:hypothetical protein